MCFKTKFPFLRHLKWKTFNFLSQGGRTPLHSTIFGNSLLHCKWSGLYMVFAFWATLTCKLIKLIESDILIVFGFRWVARFIDSFQLDLWRVTFKIELKLWVEPGWVLFVHLYVTNQSSNGFLACSFNLNHSYKYNVGLHCNVSPLVYVLYVHFEAVLSKRTWPMCYEVWCHFVFKA